MYLDYDIRVLLRYYLVLYSDVIIIILQSVSVCLLNDAPANSLQLI